MLDEIIDAKPEIPKRLFKYVRSTSLVDNLAPDSVLSNMVRQAIQEDTMAGRVARVTEVIAGSPNSFDEAIKLAFERANKTLRNITGMKIVDMSVNCDAGKILEYRIRVEVIFILE